LKSKLIVCIGLVSLLAGCGGGGGDSQQAASSTHPADSAQPLSMIGAYTGTVTSIHNQLGKPNPQYALDVVVTPENDLYVMYGSVGGTTLTPLVGFMNRHMVGSPTTETVVSSASIKVSTVERTYEYSSYYGAPTGIAQNFEIVRTDKGVTGTFNDSGVTFAGAPSTTLNLDQPASLASLTGSWNGTLLDGQAAQVNIDGKGNVTGTSGQCTFSGVAVPSGTGKNYYSLNVSFDPICQHPHIAQDLMKPNMSGIAIIHDPHTLLFAVTDGVQSDGTMGMSFAGSR
jgi:hypothetical protein